MMKISASPLNATVCLTYLPLGSSPYSKQFPFTSQTQARLQTFSGITLIQLITKRNFPLSYHYNTALSLQNRLSKQLSTTNPLNRGGWAVMPNTECITFTVNETEEYCP